MKEILKQVIHGKPHVIIGKAGISENVIDEIGKQFRRKKVLKIKFLILDNLTTKETSRQLAIKVNARVLDVRGKTCVLQRKA